MTDLNDDGNGSTDLDARLERLRLETDGVKPRADFAARTMAAIARENVPVGSLDDVMRAGRRFVAVAAFAAALAAVWAVQSAGAFDDAVAASYDAADVAW